MRITIGAVEHGPLFWLYTTKNNRDEYRMTIINFLGVCIRWYRYIPPRARKG